MGKILHNNEVALQTKRVGRFTPKIFIALATGQRKTTMFFLGTQHLTDLALNV
jgi:hypothetical protein